MDYAYYSLSLIIAYALVRYVTENTKIHLKFKGLWVHHWIIAAIAMLVVLYLEINEPYIWAPFTGVELEDQPHKIGSIGTKE